eukprot:SAG11_NODE_528_length_8722_cov_5.291198_3_plen_73_part_00
MMMMIRQSYIYSILALYEEPIGIPYVVVLSVDNARREQWNTPNVVFCFEARWGSDHEQNRSGTALARAHSPS